MNAVQDDVVKLVDKELKSANKKFSMFRSAHEGCAVILEEMEEAREALESTETLYRLLWKYTRENFNGIETISATTNFIFRNAIQLACEAIQVAAMAKKFRESMEKFNG